MNKINETMYRKIYQWVLTPTNITWWRHDDITAFLQVSVNGQSEKNVLFNDTTHFIYGYIVSDIW